MDFSNWWFSSMTDWHFFTNGVNALIVVLRVEHCHLEEKSTSDAVVPRKENIVEAFSQSSH